MEAFIAGARRPVPRLRQERLHRHPQVQPDVQDLPGRHRGRDERGLPPARDRPGHLRQLHRTSSAPPASKLPFGVCQVGKSFRNEITPGNFIFRIREFEQMELEFFCKPGTDLEWFDYWKDYLPQLAAGPRHRGGEPAAARPRPRGAVPSTPRPPPTSSILFPFGWGELWGVADRTDYDLTQHQNHSGKRSELLRSGDERALHPLCHRALPRRGPRDLLAFLCDAYDEEVVGQDKKGKDDVRTVLHLHPALAPFKVRRPAAVQEGSAHRPRAWSCMPELVQGLHGAITTTTGSIGKRYRRQDEIGTPFCVTFDFNTVGDRDRRRRPLRHCPRARQHGLRCASPSPRSRATSRSA